MSLSVGTLLIGFVLVAISLPLHQRRSPAGRHPAGSLAARHCGAVGMAFGTALIVNALAGAVASSAGGALGWAAVILGIVALVLACAANFWWIGRYGFGPSPRQQQ